jgi:mRNA-degrading endonuclease RelE of RelBE toxin-antitoxin system
MLSLENTMPSLFSLHDEPFSSLILVFTAAPSVSMYKTPRFFEQFMDAAESLRVRHDFAPMAKDLQIRLRGYRTLSVGDYILFYTINGKTVELRRILFAKRRYSEVL